MARWSWILPVLSRLSRNSPVGTAGRIRSAGCKGGHAMAAIWLVVITALTSFLSGGVSGVINTLLSLFKPATSG